MIKRYNQGNLWGHKCIRDSLFRRVTVHHGGVEATLHTQHEAAAAAHSVKAQAGGRMHTRKGMSLETSKATLRDILHLARSHLLILIPAKLGQVFKCKHPGKHLIHTSTLSEHSQMPVTLRSQTTKVTHIH